MMELKKYCPLSPGSYIYTGVLHLNKKNHHQEQCRSFTTFVSKEVVSEYGTVVSSLFVVGVITEGLTQYMKISVT